MGTKLPRKLEQKMELMGEQIKLARLRRNLSIAQVAERATLLAIDYCLNQRLELRVNKCSVIRREYRTRSI